VTLIGKAGLNSTNNVFFDSLSLHSTNAFSQGSDQFHVTLFFVKLYNGCNKFAEKCMNLL